MEVTFPMKACAAMKAALESSGRVWAIGPKPRVITVVVTAPPGDQARSSGEPPIIAGGNVHKRCVPRDA